MSDDTLLRARRVGKQFVRAGRMHWACRDVAFDLHEGEVLAVFEATHGTAPGFAGKDRVNPGSLILSAEMMLRYIGWKEAADRIVASLEKTIAAKTVTYDLARLIDGAKELKTSEFANAMIANM